MWLSKMVEGIWKLKRSNKNGQHFFGNRRERHALYIVQRKEEIIQDTVNILFNITTQQAFRPWPSFQINLNQFLCKNFKNSPTISWCKKDTCSGAKPVSSTSTNRDEIKIKLLYCWWSDFRKQFPKKVKHVAFYPKFWKLEWFWN